MAESMMNFTCISCRVVFVDARMQRDHYRTDWHRYNLKRKVAELPPVSAENFKERVLTQKAMLEAAEVSGKQANYCKVCRKHFSSENASESHTRSKKHKEKVSKLQQSEEKKQVDSLNLQNVDNIMGRGTRGENENEAAEVVEVRDHQHPVESEQKAGGQKADEPKAGEEEEEGEWEDVEGLAATDCLFCPRTSPDLEANLAHMSRAHSFFLPDARYLVNLVGLVEYLGEKVGAGFECLFCGERGRAFRSLEAAQKHMVDKGHTQVSFEGDRALEYADFYDYRSSYPGQQRPAGEEGEELEEGGEGGLVVNDNLELVLPSGATLVHRSLKLYYKQNLTGHRGGRGQVATTAHSRVHRVLVQHRALGYSGPSSVEVAKRVIRSQAFGDRVHQQRMMKLGCRGNKLQTHFRLQTGFCG